MMALCVYSGLAFGALATDNLDRGIEAYQRGDFDAAVPLLSKAASELERDAPRAARARLFLGFALVALGQEPQAEAELERALTLDPNVDASSASPKILEVLDRVRGRLEARKGDRTPPEVKSITVFPVAEGAPLDFVVEASDPSGISAARIDYRVKGGKSWAFFPLTPSTPTQFAGSLPAVAALPPGIEYYAEAWDRAGNGPGRLGDPNAPRFVEVRAAAPKKPSSPFYERWWFWTGIGAAAVGGTIAAVTLGREKTVHVTVTATGQ
jgi:tetratricopeptide (TPR) repeat protein